MGGGGGGGGGVKAKQLLRFTADWGLKAHHHGDSGMFGTFPPISLRTVEM